MAPAAWYPAVPTGLSSILWGCDVGLLREKTLERSTSLFSSVHDEIELWIASDPAVLEKSRLEPSDIERLDAYVDAHARQLDESETTAPKATAAHTNRAVFCFIDQGHSWDRLKVTGPTFDSLMRAIQVFPHFMETVLAFGLKIKNDYNTWHGFHSRRQCDVSGGYEVLETCYTIRFVERNNRGANADPWSPRQTGVYHRFCASTNQSTWILIKPSPHLKERLWTRLEDVARLGNSPEARHVFLHVLVIYFALRNWPGYIATQTKNIAEFEEKSFFSEADYIEKYDYDLRFEDRQMVQRLSHKLLGAAAMLDATIHLGERIRNLMNRCQLRTELQDAVTAELEDYDAEAKYYRRCLADLQTRASHTASLLLDILNRRYGHATLRSAAANEESVKANANSLATMTRVAVTGEKARELDQKTSVNVRALTFVATLYLPASLLAAIFSSSLVSLNSEGSYVVASQFWKYVIVLLPMTAMTFAGVLALETVWKGQGRRRKINRHEDGLEASRDGTPAADMAAV